MEQHRWVQGWQLNAFGSLFGGTMLSWVDEDTNMFAYNSSEQPDTHYTTAGYDKVSFIKPCSAGDRLKFIYDIIHYGNKSVTIRCIVTNQYGWKVFSCLTTMVKTKGFGLTKEVKGRIEKLALWDMVENLKELRKKEPPL